MGTIRRPGRKISWTMKIVVAVVTVPFVYVAWDQATYNFGTVQPGRIYRSGQMPRHALERTIHQNHIKTVLNLRGSNRREAWYRDEVKTTNRAGATQVDIAMSSCVWMSRTVAGARRRTRYRGVSDLDPLRMGIGAQRVGLGVRGAASPRRHA